MRDKIQQESAILRRRQRGRWLIRELGDYAGCKLNTRGCDLVFSTMLSRTPKSASGCVPGPDASQRMSGARKGTPSFAP